MKLLDDQGGVELAKTLLQRNEESSTQGHHHLRTPLGHPHCKELLTGADVANIDRWIIQLNMYVVGILPVSSCLIFFMTYASIKYDMCH